MIGIGSDKNERRWFLGCYRWILFRIQAVFCTHIFCTHTGLLFPTNGFPTTGDLPPYAHLVAFYSNGLHLFPSTYKYTLWISLQWPTFVSPQIQIHLGNFFAVDVTEAQKQGHDCFEITFNLRIFGWLPFSYRNGFYCFPAIAIFFQFSNSPGCFL